MIRASRPADADAIARVHVASWRAAYPHIFPPPALASLSEAKLRGVWSDRISRDAGSILVLEQMESVLGFVHLGATRDADRDPDRVGEVYALYLDAAAWGQGHGAALWSAALQWLVVREYVTVTLWVLEQNRRGRTFYESVGFRCDHGSRRWMERFGVEVVELRYERAVIGP